MKEFVFRKSLSQELQAKEDLRAKYHLEVGKRAEISKSNRIVEEELERNSDRIQQLESMINELKQNQKQNIKQPLHQDYPQLVSLHLMRVLHQNISLLAEIHQKKPSI